MPVDRSPSNSIKLLLVEDHDVVRESLSARLNAEPDIYVVAAVGTVEAALEQVTSQPPDVAVLDVGLPDGDGVTLCRRIRAVSPSTRCIIHTGTDLDPETAIRAGAVAVVLKQLIGDRLLQTIRDTPNSGPNEHGLS